MACIRRQPGVAARRGGGRIHGRGDRTGGVPAARRGARRMGRRPAQTGPVTTGPARGDSAVTLAETLSDDRFVLRAYRVDDAEDVRVSCDDPLTQRFLPF